MTDKETIIDGIDVSGCEYYNKDDKTCREVNGNYDTDICEFDKCENSNCYYKQLKRKEKECEKLNKQVNDLLNKPEIQDKILWKIDNKALLESKDAWIYKLEQTLTEIKEIADKDFRHTAWEEYAKQLKQILQKISECEVEDAR